jgi:hypothetical protein
MPKKPCLRIKSEAQGAQQAERDMGAHCRKASRHISGGRKAHDDRPVVSADTSCLRD